ncbi:hypothetical protein GF377_09390 [candidate division GN15 bacterium]|nr:hypothetical protein [candidate division GN15 bacterium]
MHSKKVWLSGCCCATFRTVPTSAPDSPFLAPEASRLLDSPIERHGYCLSGRRRLPGRQLRQPEELTEVMTDNSANKNNQRYEVLRDLALAGGRGRSLEDTVRTALSQAAQLVGLNGAAVYLWGEEQQVTLQVQYADSDTTADRLQQLETSLFKRLREEDDLVSAYMTLGGTSPCHSFTLPLQHGDDVLGAVVGVQFGERTIVAEDLFLEALSAAMAVQSLVTQGGAGSVSDERIEKERLTAIVETAVTVNHEINNPLTAILGNVQLLLLKRDELDEDLRKKLEVVESAATKIKDVTQRLMALTSARSVGYTNGTSMIDISDHPRSDSETSDSESE